MHVQAPNAAASGLFAAQCCPLQEKQLYNKDNDWESETASIIFVLSTTLYSCLCYIPTEQKIIIRIEELRMELKFHVFMFIQI